MEKEAVKHLQAIILDIVKDLDKLCVDNHINYYLLGGSAIGAIRHKGFIPWDDDLDIIMDDSNYQRFISLCKSQLDNTKYTVQEGLKDWSMYYSKVILKGTTVTEDVPNNYGPEAQGIFVDVFKMDNVPSSKILSFWQYFCAKYFLCYQLLTRSGGISHLPFRKQIMIVLSIPLRIKCIREFFKNQVEKYNNVNTQFVGFFYGRTNFRTSIVKKVVFGKPLRVPFEDTQLPVAQKYDEYLTHVFGDYMTPPPIEKQKGLHILSVDFGDY